PCRLPAAAIMMVRTLVCALAGTLAAASMSFGQAYPAKAIRVIVPSAAGGGADIVARAIGQKLTAAWGEQVVVDNRFGTVGTELAAHAPPDGYTVMLTSAAITARESVYRNLPYKTLRDFVPVSEVVSQSNVLVVHPAVPARSVQE